jgi:hypothetical protein
MASSPQASNLEIEPGAGGGAAKSDGSSTSGTAGSLSLSPSMPGDEGAPTPSGGGGTASGLGSAASSGGTSAAVPPASAGSTPPSEAAGPAAGGGGGGASTAGTGTSTHPIQPGTLTAGAWDDNLNFDFFSAYRQRMDVVYGSELLPFKLDDYEAANRNYAQPGGPKTTLDVALVIDTTGSMGDEMLYLQTEFSALSQAIATEHPNAEQRWSLIVYRDVGDEYVVRSFDFSADTVDFKQHLAAQSAGGGGDFPEAPDQALAAVPSLGWRQDDQTARLAFWVADAPNHPENNQAMVMAIQGVGAAGVHIYPVASSGIDEVTELTMRSAAELTGGRYLFLTDDSGVGNAHKEPTIPCYFVTKLDDAIERMVDIELTGVYREPDPSEIIRTGGDPQSRACELDSGESVFAY